MYYIFVNPASRSGKGAVVWESAKQWLDRHQVAYRLYYTKPNVSIREEWEQIVSEAPDGPIRLLAIGGDGTLNQCINGITDLSRVELSHIPTGSGDDFIRNKKIPATLPEQLTGILSGAHRLSVDIGTATFSLADGTTHTRRFLVSAGLGYDAEVCDYVNRSRWKKRFNRLHLGKLVYLALGVKALLTNRTTEFSLSVDGAAPIVFPRTFFLCAMNQPCEGGGVRMTPDANDTDGLLHLCVFYNRNKLGTLCALLKLYAGKQSASRGTALLSGRELSLTAKTPHIAHYDGECFSGCTSMRVLIEGTVPFVF